MKALFESRFPFIKLPDEQLDEQQLKIKQQYVNTYFHEEEPQVDRLQSVHGNDERVEGKSRRTRNKTGGTE